MVALPVFQSLTVENYGLYPPSLEKPLNFQFKEGPTVIVGVNGSGKTTLTMMQLRMLSGAFDLPAGRSDEGIGQIDPNIVPLRAYDKAYFAKRVADGAKDAFATLKVSFGKTEVEIKRHLASLDLIRLILRNLYLCQWLQLYACPSTYKILQARLNSFPVASHPLNKKRVNHNS